MTTVKLCTDLLQSKKLAEFLPHKSADMYYHNCYDGTYNLSLPTNGEFKNKRFFEEHPDDIPAWSLAALLDVLPKDRYKDIDLCFGGYKHDKYIPKWFCSYEQLEPIIVKICEGPNAIDTCYELALKLHELKML